MTEIEKYISEQIAKFIPSYEKLEVYANIGDTSYSVEFFVTVNGIRKQCFDMVDDGLIKEKELDIVFRAIADYVRNTRDYIKGKVYKISMIVGN